MPSSYFLLEVDSHDRPPSGSEFDLICEAESYMLYNYGYGLHIIISTPLQVCILDFGLCIRIIII